MDVSSENEKFGAEVAWVENFIDLSRSISRISAPIEVSGKEPSNISCIPSESGVENICLLSTMPSSEYFCWTRGNIKSKYQVGILKDAGPFRSQPIKKDKRIKSQKGVEVIFSKVKNANHFFKNKEKELSTEIEKYLKEKTALI